MWLVCWTWDARAVRPTGVLRGYVVLSIRYGVGADWPKKVKFAPNKAVTESNNIDLI